MATDVFMRNDFFEHSKIATLRDYSDWALNTELFIRLYMLADYNGDKIIIPASMTPEKLAKKLRRVSKGQIEKAIEIFAEVGLAKRRDDGALALTEIEVLFKERDVAEVF